MARNTEQTIVVKGLRPLQASMRRASKEASRELKTELRGLGKLVLNDARSIAPTGPRPKRSSTPPLAGSLRLSVTNRGVSVYSNAAHAYVQDRGGKVGHGAIIPRASASGYMTKAVGKNRPAVVAGLKRILDKIDGTITTRGAG